MGSIDSSLPQNVFFPSYVISTLNMFLLRIKTKYQQSHMNDKMHIVKKKSGQQNPFLSDHIFLIM